MKEARKTTVEMEVGTFRPKSDRLPRQAIQKGFDRKCLPELMNLALRRLDRQVFGDFPRCFEKANPTALIEEIGASALLNFSQPGTRDQAQVFKALVDLLLGKGIRVYSPQFMGRQYSGVVPVAAIFEMVMAIANQPSSFYEAAPVPNVAENLMKKELIEIIGYSHEDNPGMITTSGGALANLTAILSARNWRYPEVWVTGLSGRSKENRLPAVAMSEECHYSLRRAIGIVGIGESQIINLPVSPVTGRIKTARVKSILDRANQAGMDVFCLIGSAGTTSRGTIDSLDLLAGIAEQRKIWFHVDGSHGASLMLSPRHCNRLRGIEMADSFSWDAHKMLRVPSPSSLLFYKNKTLASQTFTQEASYVFDSRDPNREFETAHMNFECTKRPMIVPFWALRTLYGYEIFAQTIDYACSLTKDAYRYLSRQVDFQVIHQPHTNILCFRYKPSGLLPGLVSEFQKKLRESIISEGRFFISKVDIEGRTALRVVFLNHETSFGDFVDLVNELRLTGERILTTN